MIYLKVKENSTQAKIFIEFARTMSFIDVVEEDCVEENSTKKHTKSLKTTKNIPNNITLKAMKDAEMGNVIKSKNVKDLISKLES